MERCTNHTILVYGSSSRPYTVSVKNFLPTCTCISYAINHNRAKSRKAGVKEAISWCKHLTAQFDRLCRWQGTEEDQVIPGLCPRCSSPTEVIENEEEIA